MATESPAAELGLAAPAFSLPATDGRTHTLDDVSGTKGLVVIFMCNHCPYVQAALPRIVREARALAALGIGTVGINSKRRHRLSGGFVQTHVALAAERQLPFPYLHDETQQVARAYGAVCTPEFYGFDANLLLRYRGRLDAHARTRFPTRAGNCSRRCSRSRKPAVGPDMQYPALGCSIKWKSA